MGKKLTGEIAILEDPKNKRKIEVYFTPEEMERIDAKDPEALKMFRVRIETAAMKLREPPEGV